jgi:hypothetical protein
MVGKKHGLRFLEGGELFLAGRAAELIPLDIDPQGHVPRVAPFAIPNVIISLRHKLHTSPLKRADIFVASHRVSGKYCDNMSGG